MKKMLLFCCVALVSCVRAELHEDLVYAIAESKVLKVKKLLAHTALSRREYDKAFDLAEKVIFVRKDTLGVAVKRGRYGEKYNQAYKETLFIRELGIFGVMVGLLGAVDTCFYQCGVGFFKADFRFMALLFSIGAHLYSSRLGKTAEHLYRDDYDKAVEVYQLLLRHAIMNKQN